MEEEGDHDELGSLRAEGWKRSETLVVDRPPRQIPTSPRTPPVDSSKSCWIKRSYYCRGYEEEAAGADHVVEASGLGDERFSSLVERLEPGLSHAVLRGNGLTDRSAPTLEKLARRHELRVLDLSQNELGPRAMAALARLSPKRLQRLDLRSNRWAVDALELGPKLFEFCATPSTGRAMLLGRATPRHPIADNPALPEGESVETAPRRSELVKLLRNSRVSALALSGVEPGTARLLAKLRLTALDVSFAFLGPARVLPLARIETLTWLNLRHNAIRDGVALARALDEKHLTFLDLSSNMLGPPTARAIDLPLAAVDLSHNPMIGRRTTRVRCRLALWGGRPLPEGKENLGDLAAALAETAPLRDFTGGCGYRRGRRVVGPTPATTTTTTKMCEAFGLLGAAVDTRWRRGIERAALGGPTMMNWRCLARRVAPVSGQLRASFELDEITPYKLMRLRQIRGGEAVLLASGRAAAADADCGLALPGDVLALWGPSDDVVRRRVIDFRLAATFSNKYSSNSRRRYQPAHVLNAAMLALPLLASPPHPDDDDVLH